MFVGGLAEWKKTCPRWQLNGSQNQKALFKFDSWSMGGERCVRRNKPGSPSVSAGARWVWTLSTQSDFHFKQFFITKWWLDDSAVWRTEEVFLGEVWRKAKNEKELQYLEKPQNTCWAPTRRTNSALEPSPRRTRWSSACRVNMSQQISCFFPPVDALSGLAVAES